MTEQESTELEQWLATERTKVIDAKDQIIFDEVAGCLKNGYRRSAYIMSWIAIIESLKRKIYKFANLGDSSAKKAVEEIENLEAAHKSADVFIYDQAKKCGILADSDVSAIEFFWKKRCVFGHPYETQPTLEENKYIVIEGVRLVLGTELTYNKSYLDEICSMIVDSPHFLPNDIELIKAKAQKIVARTPEHLFPYFFKSLLFKIGQFKDETEPPIEVQKLRIFIIELLRVAKKPLLEAEYGFNVRVTRFPFTSFCGFVHHEIWEHIPMEAKETLLNYLESTPKNKEQDYYVKFFVKHIREKDKLIEAHAERYCAYLNKQSFDKAVEFYGNNFDTYTRIITEMETYTYTVQNVVVDYLRQATTVELVNSFTAEQQIGIGKVIQNAAKNNHFSSKNIKTDILKKERGFSDWVRIGIIISILENVKNMVGANKGELLATLEMLNKVELSVRKSVYELLSSYYQDLEVQRFDFWKAGKEEDYPLEELDDFVGVIEFIATKITWADGHRELFEELKSTVIEKYQREQKGVVAISE